MDMKKKKVNKSPKTESGALGEAFAAQLLAEKGFVILEKNYLCRFGEIDIIVKDDKYIIFVEVKTRKPKAVVSASYSVGIIKQRKIIKTAMIYLSENFFDLQPRFDVIEIEYERLKPFTVSKFNHIENAFMTEDANGPF